MIYTMTGALMCNTLGNSLNINELRGCAPRSRKSLNINRLRGFKKEFKFKKNPCILPSLHYSLLL
jgi:hypothetical protein